MIVTLPAPLASSTYQIWQWLEPLSICSLETHALLWLSARVTVWAPVQAARQISTLWEIGEPSVSVWLDVGPARIAVSFLFVGADQIAI